MSGKKPIVAVVDDDQRLLESLEDLLESAGYGVRAFASAEALLASGLGAMDVLVTDIGMPGMDGFALRDLVQERRPELPVLLITGRHEFADRNPARASGRLFRKPFDGRALLAAIDHALRNREEEGDP